MLTSLIFTLTGECPARLPLYLGRASHAILLNLISEEDPEAGQTTYKALSETYLRGDVAVPSGAALVRLTDRLPLRGDDAARTVAGPGLRQSGGNVERLLDCSMTIRFIQAPTSVTGLKDGLFRAHI